MSYAANSFEEIETFIMECLDNPDTYDPQLTDCICLNTKQNKIY